MTMEIRGTRMPRTVCLILLALTFGAGGAKAQSPLLQAERHKNFGVAYLEEKRTVDAERAFRRVVELVPGEALGYANLGVALLRSGNLDAAASLLEQARRVDSKNVEVLLLGAQVQLALRHWKSVVALCRQAIEIDPRNATARYTVFRAASLRKGDSASKKAAATAITELRTLCPENVVIALKYARFHADNKQWEKVARTIPSLQSVVREQSSEKAAKAMADIERALAARNGPAFTRHLTILENLLRPTARARWDLQAIQPPVAGLPLLRFSPAFYDELQHERPHRVPVEFTPMAQYQLPGVRSGSAQDAAGSLDFADIDGDARDDILVGFSNGRQHAVSLWRSRNRQWDVVSGKSTMGALTDVRFADFDNDNRFDILAVGSGGLVLLRSAENDAWCDVTESTGLASEPSAALELIDADNEGDLDLCVAGSKGFRLWQNRPDSTFRDLSMTSGLAKAGPGARQTVTTDHDDDLDTDLIIIDHDGRVRLFDNMRHGQFQEADRGLTQLPCRFVTARDFDNDGYEDLVMIRGDCEQALVLQQNNNGMAYLPPIPIPLDGIAADAMTALDFDNDGWLDLAVAGHRKQEAVLAILRNRGDGTWKVHAVNTTGQRCVALGSTDVDRDGDLDLVALDRVGRLRTWRNDGGNSNHWLRVQLKGLRIAGSKNNVHGIGSKVEIKAGRFYQMQFVRQPATHFGLGQRAQADLLRVVWSNGVPQNRFHCVANQTIREPQVLKGSCPYLYCWDGERFTFVTDTLAGAPLGLQLAAGVVAPDNPRELLTIKSDKIAPRQDRYVFQYTSELWETVYLDKVALWVVDHPARVEVFTDQRFLPPPYGPPAPIFTRSRVPPRRAVNSRGDVVTNRLLEFDHQYPEQLRSKRYQGVVEPHRLTLEFGDVRQLERPALVLGCWIFWTDTSINVAMSQAPTTSPGPTTVEVWHPDSGWHEIERPFGLPCGKDKWVVYDLADHLYMPDARVRLRSESQIYWDQAFLADRVASVSHAITKLAPFEADLHYGGFHRLYRPTEDGPHLYRYGQTTDLPVWLNMTGWATRYGDVTELLTTTDDRFAIFTGGDEVSIAFDATAMPRLPAGWERDFLFFSDGWEKDSDRNTVTGDTVGPLPFHAMSSYPYPRGEAYPGDALHREYLRRYNTRRIGPDAFRRFVREYGKSPAQLPWAAEPGVRGDHSK